jgi:hypothetical protein
MDLPQYKLREEFCFFPSDESVFRAILEETVLKNLIMHVVLKYPLQK